MPIAGKASLAEHGALVRLMERILDPRFDFSICI